MALSCHVGGDELGREACARLETEQKLVIPPLCGLRLSMLSLGARVRLVCFSFGEWASEKRRLGFEQILLGGWYLWVPSASGRGGACASTSLMSVFWWFEFVVQSV